MCAAHFGGGRSHVNKFEQVASDDQPYVTKKEGVVCPGGIARMG